MAKRGSKVAKKAKKKGLSLAKLSNIQKYKRAKRGEYTEAEKKKRKLEKKEKRKVTYAELHNERRRVNELKAKYAAEEEVYPLSAEVTGEEMSKMMEPDDLEYLVDIKGKKRRRKDNQDLQENDLIQECENEERNFNTHPTGKNIKELLPYKTEKGVIPRYVEIKEELIEAEVEQLPSLEEEVEEKKEIKEEKPKIKSTVEFMVERQKKLDEKKIIIGCTAANFIREPEGRLSGLTKLINFMEEPDPDVAVTVKKYAALSLLEIFHNIIPAYPLHHHNIDQKLKKETQKLYVYENHILSTYQSYLKNLESMLNEEKNKRNLENEAVKQVVMVALRCMGELLTRHIHFNYTNNIIQALVPYLNHRDDDIYSLVTSFFTKLFKTDKPGHLSLEVIRCLNNFVRKKAFRVQPEIFKILLQLKIKNCQNLDDDIQAKLTAKRKLTHKEKLIKKLTEKNKAKMSNKDTKIFRKKRKLEEQMKDIRNEKTTRQRNVQHTKIIQLVFGLYIHVLKRRPNNNLIGVVLEGLAKFAHLINIEFFADLLNVLGELMSEGSLKFRESLHCIQVVFTILSGQGEVLTLDPQRFYKYLYANMLRLSAGTNHNDVRSALESLKQILVEHRRRASALRVQAFTKRLATLSLALLHSGTIASLATLRRIMLNHASTEALLETDMEGASGIFSAEIEEPEHCNAGATTMWELHLLRRHYHSTVQQMSEHILCGAPLQGEKTLPYTLTKRSIEELYEEYDPSKMRFNPAIPAPSQHISNRLSSRTKWHAKKQKGEHWSTQYMREETKDVLMAGLLTDGQANVNSHPTIKVNGLCKENGVSEGETPLIIKMENINFSSGMLSNMNIDKIPVRKIQEDEYDEDITLSLLKIETKS